MDDTLILGRYRPLEKAGAGAFGTVQVAWDTTIQRKVAIKCIRLSAADAYALTQDSARTSGASVYGAAVGAAGAVGAASAAGAGAFGDAALAQMAAGLSDDLADAYGEDFGEGAGAYGDPYGNPYGEGGVSAGAGARGAHAGKPRSRVTNWLSRTFGTGTVKLSPEERGAARGKGVTPLGAATGAGAAAAHGAFASNTANSGAFSNTFPANLGTGEHFLASLPGLDEARTAALLSDAHIVAVYDFQVVGCMAYLIMEYVEGMTLTRFLRDYDDELSLDIIGAVFADIAHALVVAHGSGVLHLDIKPDNVLIDKRGQVKVTDFGLATLADAQGFGLAGGGTIGYMPPEQMMQEQLDARTDEWALASIAYEMLTGKNPFVAADTLDDALCLIDEAELVLPSLCWRGLDARVDDVLFCALDPERDGRYDAVADFAADMQPLLGNVAAGHRALAEIVGAAGADSLLETAAPGLAAGAGVAAGAGNAWDTDDWDDHVYGAVGLRGAYGEGGEGEGGRGSGSGYGRGNNEGLRGVHDTPRPTAARAGGHFFGIFARIIGFFFSGALMLVACLNIPLFSTFQEPIIRQLLQQLWPAALEIAALQNSLLWALVVVCAVLAAVKPTWGALAALSAFGVALAWRANIWLGLAVVLVAWLWWYCTGRRGNAQANCGLAYPLLGSFGCVPAAPLATGLGMGVLDAACTALFGVFLCMVCASLGSADMLNWQLGTYWNFAEANLAVGFGATVASLRNWVLAAGMLLAAVVGALCALPRRRWMNVLGTALGAVLLVAALFVGTWLGSGQVSWVPQTPELVKMLLCGVAAVGAAAAFIPEHRARR